MLAWLLLVVLVAGADDDDCDGVGHAQWTFDTHHVRCAPADSLACERFAEWLMPASVHCVLAANGSVERRRPAVGAGLVNATRAAAAMAGMWWCDALADERARDWIRRVHMVCRPTQPCPPALPDCHAVVEPHTTVLYVALGALALALVGLGGAVLVWALFRLRAAAHRADLAESKRL